MTLRRILSHTTGLPPAGKNFGPRDPDALRRFVWEEIAHYAFVAQPGRVHLYSNTVFVFAGYLAEVVTGKYYDALMQELIFAPLEMQRSTFDRTVAMLPVRVFLALGQIGWRAVIDKARDAGWYSGRIPKFGHAAKVQFNTGQWLVGSYHPSQQNTFTGRLTEEMLDQVFEVARELIHEGQ